MAFSFSFHAQSGPLSVVRVLRTPLQSQGDARLLYINQYVSHEIQYTVHEYIYIYMLYIY